MTALTLRNPQLAASIRTLRRTGPAERVLVDCLVRNRGFPACQLPAGCSSLIRISGGCVNVA